MKHNNSPIFIVGCGRSGTTLLRLMLNKHSKIAIPEETWYFPYLDKQKQNILQSGEGDWKARVANYIFANTRTHFPDLKKEQLESELQNLTPNDWPAIVSAVNSRFAKEEKKPRWGDKTPGYVTHLPLLKKLFPDAYIVHIIRDGRDVIPSILKYWSVGPQTNSYLETALYWKKHVSKGIKEGPLYFKNQYMELKYEDLIQDPEKKLRELCKFIKEDYEEQMLDTFEDASKYVPKWEWHQNTSNSISAERISVWKTNINLYQLALFNLTCGNLIKKLKYEPQNSIHWKAFLIFFIYKIREFTKKTTLSIKVSIIKLKRSKNGHSTGERQ